MPTRRAARRTLAALFACSALGACAATSGTMPAPDGAQTEPDAARDAAPDALDAPASDVAPDAISPPADAPADVAPDASPSRDGAACGPIAAYTCSVTHAAWAHPDRTQLGLAANEGFGSFAQRTAAFTTIAHAGVGMVRAGVAWGEIQAHAGAAFDFGTLDPSLAALASNGVQIVGLLSITADWDSSAPAGAANPVGAYPARTAADYVAYVRALVRHYGPGGVLTVPIRDWEIFNEPNMNKFWAGTNAQLLAQLDAAYTAIHAIDPGARVWGPSVTREGVVDTSPDAVVSVVLASGRFDLFSYHNYDDASSLLDTYRTVRARLDAIAHTATGVPGSSLRVAITETNLRGTAQGFCPYDTASQLATQPDVLEDTFVCLANAGVEHIFWWKIADGAAPNPPCADGIFHDGVLDTSLAPKPDLARMTAMSRAASSCSP